jgi:hypothetical protein
MRLPALCAAAAAFALATSAALADEFIEFFGSDVSVRTDGTLHVEETIRVHAEGKDIKHGIFRDVVSLSRLGDGPGDSTVRFLDVTRDGQAETYQIVRSPNGVRLYAGRDEVLLSTGTHTYQLVYEARGRVAPGDGRMLWEVTGAWPFPIEELRFRLRIPGSAAPSEWIATLTRSDVPVSDRGVWSETKEDDGVGLQTLRPLAPGEGIVIAARVFVPA